MDKLDRLGEKTTVPSSRGAEMTRMEFIKRTSAFAALGGVGLGVVGCEGDNSAAGQYNDENAAETAEIDTSKYEAAELGSEEEKIAFVEEQGNQMALETAKYLSDHPSEVEALRNPYGFRITRKNGAKITFSADPKLGLVSFETTDQTLNVNKPNKLNGLNASVTFADQRPQSERDYPQTVEELPEYLKSSDNVLQVYGFGATEADLPKSFVSNIVEVEGRGQEPQVLDLDRQVHKHYTPASPEKIKTTAAQVEAVREKLLGS